MSAIDPITREIIQNALAATADEMAVALYRTAYSTVVRDCLDYSTSLCAANGDMIAQGVTIPLHLGAVPYAMETLFAKFEGDMEPGDVFIMNDPFDGGMHIPDIFIVKPIFQEEERIGFAVSTAHHLDLGGRLPGSSACDNTEIFHDGLRIPWLKLHHRGVPDDALYTLLRANVRVPRMTLGDLNAQLSACHIGERRILELAAKYGVETFRSCAADLIDYTERLVRAEIASWPDGSHTFTDYLDSNGVGGPRVKLKVTITVEGDSLTADFRGTDPQAPGAINNSLSFTASVATLCVRSVFREEIPNTAGMFRPIRIVTEPGTVVHGVMPAASSMRGITGFRLVDTMFGALSGIVPDRVMAAGEGGNSLVIIGGEHEDKSPYVYFELICGTWGGRPDRDGIDGITNPANVASNVPVEQAESEYPLRIERYGLVDRQRRSRQVPRRHGHRARVDPAEGRRPPRHPLRPPRPPAVRAVRRPAGIAVELDPARARRRRGAADHDLDPACRRGEPLPPAAGRRRLGRPAGAAAAGGRPGRRQRQGVAAVGAPGIRGPPRRPLGSAREGNRQAAQRNPRFPGMTLAGRVREDHGIERGHRVASAVQGSSWKSIRQCTGHPMATPSFQCNEEPGGCFRYSRFDNSSCCTGQRR